MSKKETTTTVEQTNFDLLIYKFLNHSSNSMFYGILTVSLFAVAILNTKTLSVTETINPITGTLIMILLSVIAGLALWQHSINRQDYKSTIQQIVEGQANRTSEDKTDEIMEAVKEYKKTVLEKIRMIRLFFGIMTAIYLVLISFVIGDIAFNSEVSLFSSDNIMILILGSVSLIASIILSLVITIIYRKGLNTRMFEVSELQN